MIAFDETGAVDNPNPRLDQGNGFVAMAWRTGLTFHSEEETNCCRRW